MFIYIIYYSTYTYRHTHMYTHGELLRVHVPASARILVPLFAKASLGLYEPIEWRGGAPVPLAKRAAAALSCDRFRSILISSLPGKVYHRQLRTLLMPALQKVRGDTQAGAVPGISTSLWSPAPIGTSCRPDTRLGR